MLAFYSTQIFNWSVNLEAPLVTMDKCRQAWSKPTERKSSLSVALDILIYEKKKIYLTPSKDIVDRRILQIEW